MVHLYILRSQTTGKFYVGVTERLNERLAEHNRGQTQSTKGRGPWDLALTEIYDDLVSAQKREREIKAWKSHTKIVELIEGRASR